MQTSYKRNRYTFGIGTIGRDMSYTLISMYLMFYFTSVANITTTDLYWVTGIMVGWRVVDAVSDPLMGILVDNTNTRWGKHKPWILIGMLLTGLFILALFWDFGLHGAAFVALFTFIYAGWALTYSLNDIAFWSYVPALSQEQKERENIGSKARIFALIGTFFVVAGIVPITSMLGKASGSTQKGYFLFAAIIVGIMWLGQIVTLIGVKEPKGIIETQQHTSFRDFIRAIFQNDQLLIIAVAMGLFMIGYTTTTSFGLFYFQYVFGNVGMYSIFAIILGLSQIASLIAFPYVGKILKRKTIYLISTLLVILGYIIFGLSPTSTMLFVGIGGFLIFVGQASIQLLMLLFLADTVEYGHWKLGKRNDSVTFSLQPFIYKIGGAAANGIVGLTVVWAGIKGAKSGTLISGSHLMIFKSAMFILPLVCIGLGYLIYHFKFKIDELKYAEILSSLKAKGEIRDEA
ncbi:MAG: glycoside-pentoside-hexuronide (GPH):cation symporter [Streptococcaceae bacterium]|jgi:melibiose permease/lactose/raffinose/galactose permease|nr:glycoside-pentoside-hexuronide (GPH):cation symporter [Streptococcaceae bacterium]